MVGADVAMADDGGGPLAVDELGLSLSVGPADAAPSVAVGDARAVSDEGTGVGDAELHATSAIEIKREKRTAAPMSPGAHPGNLRASGRTPV